MAKTGIMDKRYICNVLSCGELSFGETAEGEFLARAYGHAENVARLVALGALSEVADDEVVPPAPIYSGEPIPPTNVTEPIKSEPVAVAPTTEGQPAAAPAAPAGAAEPAQTVAESVAPKAKP